MLALLLLAALQAPVQPDTLRLTITDAVSRALVVSPVVSVAAGDMARVRGLRAETLLPFPTNPTVFYGQTERTTAASTTDDTDWLISQEIEIGGQSFTRRSAMSSFLRASEARVEDARRRVALDARMAYLTLALTERQQSLIDSTAQFAERMAAFAQRQFDAGEINRLELNGSLLDAARTRSAAERARAAMEVAAAEFARILALPPDTLVRTVPLPPLPLVGQVGPPGPASAGPQSAPRPARGRCRSGWGWGQPERRAARVHPKPDPRGPRRTGRGHRRPAWLPGRPAGAALPQRAGRPGGRRSGTGHGTGNACRDRTPDSGRTPGQGSPGSSAPPRPSAVSRSRC